MQTIQKRKQWALIALALIATLTLQLFAPITAHAEETERTLDFTTKVVVPCFTESDEGIPVLYYVTQNSVVIGSGNFVIKSYCYTSRAEEGNYWKEYSSYILSDKPFTFYEIVERNGNITEFDRENIEYNGIYYNAIAGFGLQSLDGVYETSGFINMSESTQYGGYQIKEDIDNGVIDLTRDDYEEINELNPSNSSYDADIDRPIIVVDNELNYSFSNAVDGYMYEIKGRWYSVDDIELYKERLQWKYKYYSIEKNELTNWVSVSDKRSVSDTSSLVTIGSASFDDYLKSHYIPNRTYTGGTDSKGNYYLGYNDALTRIKELLASPYSVYNSPEIYVRYFYKDGDGLYHYGKWTHYYTNLAAQAGSSGSLWTDEENILSDNQSEIGLTNSQLSDLENTDNSRNDTDIETTYHNTNGNSVIIGDIEELQDTDFSNITVVILNLYEQTKTVFSMFTTVMSFLPQWVLNLIGTSVTIICLVGIWKAIT